MNAKAAGVYSNQDKVTVAFIVPMEVYRAHQFKNLVSQTQKVIAAAECPHQQTFNSYFLDKKT